MSILESIREYFSGCPFLKIGPLGVDYLGEQTSGYAIDAVPVSSVVKTYLDGSTLRQFAFVFAGREPYGTQEDNLQNAAFYERLSDWLEAQNRAGRLPELPPGKEALSLVPAGCGYVMTNGARDARYQIQCKLNYFQGV